jgi:hypothetical protein
MIVDELREKKEREALLQNEKKKFAFEKNNRQFKTPIHVED